MQWLMEQPGCQRAAADIVLRPSGRNYTDVHYVVKRVIRGGGSCLIRCWYPSPVVIYCCLFNPLKRFLAPLL